MSLKQINHSENSVEMINEDVKRALLPRLFNAAVRAGAAIMEVYENRNNSPVGANNEEAPIATANISAHQSIKKSLGSTRIPILSEEGRAMRYDERRNWDLFWLVDPLDGTIEFMKGTNEFTVNIALMQDNECVAAAIYIPYLEKMYYASKGEGAFVKMGVKPDAKASYTYCMIKTCVCRLPFNKSANPCQRIAVSRMHQNAETVQYIQRARRNYPDAEIIEQGSSYKFCLLAEGLVDYYVRTTPTYEWDTAAGELILSEAGGDTRALFGDEKIRYNKEDLRNPWFYCKSKYSLLSH